MCRACPRELGVPRYWYLPHWTMPNTARLLARHQADASPNPSNVVEYECESCDKLHQNVSFFKFRKPITVEGRTATHFGLCETNGKIVYIRG